MKTLKYICCDMFFGHDYVEDYSRGKNRPIPFKCRRCGHVMQWYYWAFFKTFSFNRQTQLSWFSDSGTWPRLKADKYEVVDGYYVPTQQFIDEIRQSYYTYGLNE